MYIIRKGSVLVSIEIEITENEFPKEYFTEQELALITYGKILVDYIILNEKEFFGWDEIMSDYIRNSEEIKAIEKK